MVSPTRLATTWHCWTEPVEPGAVGGENVAAVGAVFVVSGVDVGPASVGLGVVVASALSVSCATTVIATAVAIVSASAPAPPQDVKSNAASMRMDRKVVFRFLCILCPFGNIEICQRNIILSAH